MATQQTKSMVSEVSICNQALSWLGQPQITSLDESSTAATWMYNNYPFLRDAVLEERMWTFATVRASSTTADLDPFGVQYAHAMPVGWLALYRVYSSVGASDPSCWTKARGWRKEGAYILTNESTVYFWGLKRVVDTGQYTQMFAQALAARIAADAAIPFTENRQLQADMWGIYEAKLAAAAARDGGQGGNETIQSNSLIDARYGYGGN